ncbi:DEAD/DEAH box helicase [Fictibacillus aquaticus]|uniref:DNA/RNA helicase n=1 Tax=Fictibacillus aquaticus TaxID=2021314 RepID=A0A235FEK2_9BACL|nr:DEAD/DEAH box helicase [Fictibacillus aquaticus]OYD59751.1 hypothetical protein CGZ90_07680 [Fictibacillus aquaticus]
MNFFDETSPDRINETLMRFLYGRILLREELPFSDEELRDSAAVRSAGVLRVNGRFVCNRCENNEQQLFASFSCFRCKRESCHYCRHCIMMGRVSECSELFEASSEHETWPVHNSSLSWEGTLSPWQAKGSEAILDAIDKKGELLIWAVCGAGKTEILFRGIEKALTLGERICIATPRTDVVLELAPRIKDVFPEVKVSALYGGSEEKDCPGQIIISTTHQLYRFKQAFNTVIVDEVDAFPYSYEQTLQNAVKKAARTNALFIYLTATPDKKLKKRAETGKLQHVKIPRRFHGRPLPVPKFKSSWNWHKELKKGKLPKPILNWLRTLQETDRSGFLFIPSIKLLETFLPSIQNIFPSAESVHSEDPNRKEKVLRFRNKEIKLLVTTTILERGVTVPKLDVAVLGAEEDIFTESALVQIAGRAGRKADDTNGSVTFFHHVKSEAMNRAVRQINLMNKEGGK